MNLTKIQKPYLIDLISIITTFFIGIKWLPMQLIKLFNGTFGMGTMWFTLIVFVLTYFAVHWIIETYIIKEG